MAGDRARNRLKPPDPKEIDACLHAHQTSIAKILFHSRGQLSLGDLHTMAWLLAYDLATELGRALDLQSEEDATHLIRRLRSECGRQVRTASRERSFDQSIGSDAEAPSLSDFLPSDEGSHPLSLLEELESVDDQPEPIELPDAYHSESAAWHWLAIRFNHRTRDMARFLLISTSWCRQRRRRARMSLAAQHLLPHAMEVRDDEDALRPWRRFKLPDRPRPDLGQLRLHLLNAPNLSGARQPSLL